MHIIFTHRVILLAATAAAVFVGVMPAQAAVTTYNTRAAFGAAVGTTIVQDFDQFVADADYTAVAVNVAGQFTIGGTGLGAFPGTNVIDVPPLVAPQTNVNGTPQIGVLTMEGINLVITFLQPITAFGADFADLNNPSNEVPFRTGIDVAGTTLLPALGGVTQFWGVVSDTPFTTVSFISYDVDRFGIDNVTFSTAVSGAVPEPATWAMLIVGFGLVGTVARRRLPVRITC